MAVQSDLMIAINQIAAERGIDPNEVLEAIKYAIKTGFRADYPEEQESLLEVEINPEEAQSIRVYANKKVVTEVTTPATQIALKDAKKIEAKLKVDDHILVDITPSGDFGRVAAQVAKQVILQKIRESEKEAVMKEFDNKMGELEYGIVQRMDADDVIFEIRRAQGVMPAKERIPGEFYKSGTRMKVLLKEIKMTPRGKQLIISRADNDFLVGLFKLEVPEISSDTVVIKSIAREPGSRSKVAVFSKTEGIDPIGACVGQKGVRINAVLNDLKFGMFEEKIDIILWNEEPTQFIANALSPATVNEVEITNADEKRVRVWVADDQLSLAIGKEGQNVRLAAKLTGWNIDIMGESQKAELHKAEKAKTKAVKAEKAEVKPKKAVVKKTAVKKAPAKKAVTEKAPAKKKAAPKKAVVKKPVTKKATVKKVVAKKAPVKKAVAKKPAKK
jgi:transcription termination/antitermination protein NusA